MGIRKWITLVVAAVALGSAATFGGCSHGGGATSSAASLSQLEQDTGVSWTTISTGDYGLWLLPLSPPPPTAGAAANPVDASKAFLSKYGGIFQMVDSAGELALEGSAGNYASFTQVEGKAAVYGTRVLVSFDASGRIEYVSSLFVPGVHGSSTTAALTPAEATAKAEAAAASVLPAGAIANPEATPAPTLILYPFGSAPALAYSLKLSYAAAPANGTTANSRYVVSYVVDASTGAVLEALNGLVQQYRGKNVSEVAGTGDGQLDGTRIFPVLATKGGGGVPKPPYYMQTPAGPFRGETFTPMFLTTPTSGAVLKSQDVGQWFTSGPDEGTAVDAYFYLGEVISWWDGKGRKGYDNASAQLGVLVDDSTCTNNAFWDTEGTIHVCPSGPDGNFNFPYAASVDLTVLGHEFQHAVNQSVMKLVFWGISSSIDESLADVFGQLIAHDELPRNAACIAGATWLPGGVRNLIDPHSSHTGAQPDNITDPLYQAPGGMRDCSSPDDLTDCGYAHANDGIPNKAWSLMTFGGRDGTMPKRGVDVSLALGWADSERLFVGLLARPNVPPAASFKDLALATIKVASADFGADKPQVVAAACAWYAVGVLSDSELESAANVRPCTCTSAEDAGSCDAGHDAGSPGDAVAPPGAENYGCYLGVGSPVRCQMGAVMPFPGATGKQDVLKACVTNGGTVVSVCPSGPTICCSGSYTEGISYLSWLENCFYGTGTSIPTSCPAGDRQTGFVVGFPTDGGLPPPPPPPPADAGADAGHDGGDAGLPPHC